MTPCLILSISRYGSRVSGAIKGKEQCPPLHLGVVDIEKRASSSLSTTVSQFICVHIYIYIYIYIWFAALKKTKKHLFDLTCKKLMEIMYERKMKIINPLYFYFLNFKGFLLFSSVTATLATILQIILKNSFLFAPTPIYQNSFLLFAYLKTY